MTHDDIKELVEKYGSEKVKKVIISLKESNSDSKTKTLKPFRINEEVDALKMINLYSPKVKGLMKNILVAIKKQEYGKLKRFHQQFNFYTKKVSEFSKEILDKKI